MIVFTNRDKTPFQIDACDYEAVSWYNWHISDVGYPVTTIRRHNQHRKLLRLHLFLLGPAPNGLQWDHRDRDKLNNQRWNFRAVTHAVNKRNVGLISTNTSGVRGVSWYARTSKWQAYIDAGRRIALGRFDNLDDACQARVKAEQDLWGNNQ